MATKKTYTVEITCDVCKKKLFVKVSQKAFYLLIVLLEK
ncbi:hypothetical protein IGJ94_002288 [Enterococcus sp. AZ153]